MRELESRIYFSSFILSTSVRLSMYTLSKTEPNEAKLHFENFTQTKWTPNWETQNTTCICKVRARLIRALSHRVNNHTTVPLVYSLIIVKVKKNTTECLKLKELFFYARSTRCQHRLQNHCHWSTKIR